MPHEIDYLDGVREKIATIIAGDIYGTPDGWVGPATRSARAEGLKKTDAVLAALAQGSISDQESAEASAVEDSRSAPAGNNKGSDREPHPSFVVEDKKPPSREAREKEITRLATIEECVNAARDGFEASMANYVLIGPSGMAMQMINSIKALSVVKGHGT